MLIKTLKFLFGQTKSKSRLSRGDEALALIIVIVVLAWLG
jgi:hypothetical protein